MMPPRKRKLQDSVGSSFYAVRAGHQPGVYGTWAECSRNITGFRGAIHKKFATESEAQHFVDDKTPTATLSASSSKGTRFYGVAAGHRPGVYTQWSDAQQQILGFKAPKYRKFSSQQAAAAFVDSGGEVSVKTSNPPTAEMEAQQEDTRSTEQGASKRSRLSINPTKSCNLLQVWTDGSSRGNGKEGAVAGVGVWFGEGDERNISEPLPGLPQTNNRAELSALMRALETVPQTQNLELLSDSNYSIKCVTVWYANWIKRGWMTSANRLVENRDLVERVRALIAERDRAGSSTTFTWVKGHADDIGNVGADALAVQGAMRSR